MIQLKPSRCLFYDKLDSQYLLSKNNFSIIVTTMYCTLIGSTYSDINCTASFSHHDYILKNTLKISERNFDIKK